jgi:hypothetical protein
MHTTSGPEKVKEITEGLEDLIDNFESDLTKHLKAKPSVLN